MFSLESPGRGDSNEYTQYTIFNMKNKNTIYYPKTAAMGFFPKGLKNKFETAAVNEPSVFEPLVFYCISFSLLFFLCTLKQLLYAPCNFTCEPKSITFRGMAVESLIKDSFPVLLNWCK